MTIALPEAQVRSSIGALASCPSPLDRLRIARPPLKVIEERDALTIEIGSAGTGAPARLRFGLDVLEQATQPTVRVNWVLDEDGGAQELDLGEDRLLNPVIIRKDLDAAVRDYLDYDYQLGSSPRDATRFADARAKACRRFGRLIDAVAVTDSEPLRAELSRQRNRDALGWLFKDDYQLKTDSPDSAYWEAPQGDPNPYEF